MYNFNYLLHLHSHDNAGDNVPFSLNLKVLGRHCQYLTYTEMYL